MTLFGDWLAETRKLQEDSYGRKYPILPDEQPSMFTENVASLVFELGEASNELGWKPWATSRHMNREAYIGELVDALHFAANLLLIADCTDQELNRAYAEKMERNRQRMNRSTEDPYTGLEICLGCKRSWDDIKAHAHGLKFWIEVTRDGKPSALCLDCYARGREIANEAG